MLIELLVIILIVAIAFWLFTSYVMPIIPAPWGRVILAILAIIIIVFLLNRYLGLGL